MPGGKKRGAKKQKRGVAAHDPAQGEPRPEQQELKEPDQPENVSRQTLVKKAYEKVSKKLDDEKQSSKAIDDLVKLLKLEKDLGGDKENVDGITVTWEPGGDESSSEK